MQPPIPIDPVLQERIESAYRLGSVLPWTEAKAAPPLAVQIQPLLGEDAEPDPTFFVESWTVGVTAASENYLRRHESPKKQEAPAPAPFPSFTFVTFLNVEPPGPPTSSPGAAQPMRDFPAARTWDQDEAEPLLSVPLTVQSACRLLGVQATSTRDEIKTAYRKLASRYHPDRLASAAVDPQQASDRMASINEAYRLLCAVALDRAV